jgi:hypothetical protein
VEIGPNDPLGAPRSLDVPHVARNQPVFAGLQLLTNANRECRETDHAYQRRRKEDFLAAVLMISRVSGGLTIVRVDMPK